MVKMCSKEFSFRLTKLLSYALAKYHIYIQNLKGNDNIDMYDYVAYLKQQLGIEKQICMNERKQSKFDKYLFIYDMLIFKK